jgi:hypothetical protein
VTVIEVLRDMNNKGSQINTLNGGRNEFGIKTALLEIRGQEEGATQKCRATCWLYFFEQKLNLNLLNFQRVVFLACFGSIEHWTYELDYQIHKQ